MNKPTHQLDRLLQSAALAPAVSPEPLSYPTEETVIASWKKRGIAAEEPWETSFYTPALAMAMGLVLLSLVFSYSAPAPTNVSDVEWSLVAFHRICSL